jgi:hypothetical protein
MNQLGEKHLGRKGVPAVTSLGAHGSTIKVAILYVPNLVAARRFEGYPQRRKVYRKAKSTAASTHFTPPCTAMVSSGTPGSVITIRTVPENAPGFRAFGSSPMLISKLWLALSSVRLKRSPGTSEATDLIANVPLRFFTGKLAHPGPPWSAIRRTWEAWFH